MSVDGSLGYWSHNNSQSPSHRRNDNDDIYKEEGLEVYLGYERRGHMSLETRHSSSSNCGRCGHIYFDIKTLHQVIAEDILEVMLVGMDLCHKRPSTIHIVIM